jgi:CDP-glycerol glycerophosphotransferase (TagB/SpsB family)
MNGAAASLATLRTWTTVARRGLARTALAAGSLLGLPVRRWSGRARRDPRLVVMGGNGDRFADNARALFLGLGNELSLRTVWITGDRTTRDRIRELGRESELRWSARGTRACLHAGWYVFDGYLGDINYWLSKGARTLNLWHGIPMKAIEFDITSGPLAHVYSAPRWSPVRLAFIDRFEPPDHLLSTSPFISATCFAPAFRIPVDRCLEYGYPRTDQLVEAAANGKAPAGRRSFGVPDGVSEVLGWFPTWRDDGSDFLADAGFSFDELDRALAAGNRHLLFKAHPNFARIGPRRPHWKNITVLDGATDVYDVLPACDVLVTDYSSIAFDFLVLQRPIIYFVPDHERYVRHRNVYFTFEEMAVGPVLTECADLYGCVRERTAFPFDALRHRQVHELVWGDYRGDAIPRLAAFLAGRGDIVATPIRPPVRGVGVG